MANKPNIKDDVNEKDMQKDSNKDKSGSSNSGRNRGKGRGRRSNRRPKSSGNDASWYNRYNELTTNSGNLNFNNPTGAKVNIYGVSDYLSAIPGCMGIRFAPVIGETGAYDTAVSRAARLLFTRITAKNNRNWTYNASDLMQYFIAYDSAIYVHAFARRIYGILHTFSNKNRYIPDGLLSAMCVDAESFRGKMAQFQYDINRMALDLSALNIPSGSTYTARHVWLNSNVFADSVSAKAQFYVPYMDSYYLYCANSYLDGSDTASGGTCALKPILSENRIDAGQYLTYDDLRTIMLEITEALLNNQDISNMSADIDKACEGKVWKWDSMPADFAILPTFNEEVLEQIQNTICYGKLVYPSVTKRIIDGIPRYDIDTSMGGVIWQDPSIGYSLRTSTRIRINTVTTQGGTTLPILPDNGPFADTGMLVNAILDTPTPDQVMVMTRNMYLAERASSDVQLWEVTLCGSEICTGYNIVVMNTVGLPTVHQTSSFIYAEFDADAGEVDWLLASRMLVAFTKFDYHPQLYLVFCSYGSTSLNSVKPVFVGDLNNYTNIKQDNLQKLHDTAIMSMFAFD